MISRSWSYSDSRLPISFPFALVVLRIPIEENCAYGREKSGRSEKRLGRGAGGRAQAQRSLEGGVE
jgi:hypothetical protein